MSGEITLITNLLPYGEDGKKAIHNISRMDSARYDCDTTERKIADCKGMGPITYQWINSNSTLNRYCGYKALKPSAHGSGG